MPKFTKAERQEALERLRDWIKPGDTIYCICRHVAASGMSRTIQLVGIKIEATGQEPTRTLEPMPLFYGFNVATLLQTRYHREREGIMISGCGMDMGFALVNDLERSLFTESEREAWRAKFATWPDGSPRTSAPAMLSHRWL